MADGNEGQAASKQNSVPTNNGQAADDFFNFASNAPAAS